MSSRSFQTERHSFGQRGGVQTHAQAPHDQLTIVCRYLILISPAQGTEYSDKVRRGVRESHYQLIYCCRAPVAVPLRPSPHPQWTFYQTRSSQAFLIVRSGPGEYPKCSAADCHSSRLERYRFSSKPLPATPQARTRQLTLALQMLRRFPECSTSIETRDYPRCSDWRSWQPVNIRSPRSQSCS